MARFTGKTVIVTGAGSGIGQAAVQRFASEGANVLAADLNTEAMKDFDGENVVAHQVDVSNWIRSRPW